MVDGIATVAVGTKSSFRILAPISMRPAVWRKLLSGVFHDGMLAMEASDDGNVNQFTSSSYC